MRLDEQRQWYEDWHLRGKSNLPVENMKQHMRLHSIQEALEGLTRQSVLVIGCGEGDELELLRAGTVVAMDLSVIAAQKAQAVQPEGFYIQANGMKLPFANARFDLVLSSEVIEHILEPDNMIEEIERVLKPGGHLLITTPNWWSFFGLMRVVGEAILRRPVTSDGQPVDNWYTPNSLTSLVRDSGLKVVKRRGAWYFPPTGLGRRRLPDRVLAKVFGALLPLEYVLQEKLAAFGHLLVVVAEK